MSTLESKKDIDLSSLPEWNLGDLFKSMDDPALEKAFKTAVDQALAFEKDYKGKIKDLNDFQFFAAIKDYEALSSHLERISSYVGLLFSGDMNNPKIGQFYQTSVERLNDITGHLIFFELEINDLDDDHIVQWLNQSPDLRSYYPWLRDVRAFRPHTLKADLEKLLHDKSVVGRSAWVRLFEETITRMRFPIQGKSLSSSDAFNYMSNPDRALRQEAGETIGKVLGEHGSVFGLITNVLAKDKEIEDQWRHYPRPDSSRNLGNFVEDKVVDALVESVIDAYPRLSHRYFQLKAKWLGLDKMAFWDRNAPLPQEDTSVISWKDARDMVQKAYHDFSPTLAGMVQDFFDKSWIDAKPRSGKDPGAFCARTAVDIHPYISMNFHGKLRDVMTLAHELGHGVHDVLSNKQGGLMAHCPLTLAETASVFGEMLTFQSILKHTTDPKQRKVILASKVEDMLNTVVRQIAFYSYEREVHAARRQGELTVDQINQIWMNVQIKALGPAFELNGDYQYYWSYIPHFIHTPFYVYAYAFGDCLVNSLYALYQQSHPKFTEKYLEMLSAGGTLRHRELLAPFGLDASDPKFWQQGLKMIESFIDELEK